MKSKTLFSMLLVITFLLSACRPAPPPQAEAPPNQPEESSSSTSSSATDKVEPVKLVFWSHWAEEENKKAVLLAAAEKFESTHPNVTVEFTWWQKAEMFPAMRNAFTAGDGFPDIFYWDRGALEFIDAGWLVDLSNEIDWSQIQSWAKQGWTRPGPDGNLGVWAVALETATDEIYYNKDIFDEIGIQVPSNYQFTAEEFYEISKQIRAAGYDPFANAVGDSALMGTYLNNFFLARQLGAEGLTRLYQGEKSWNDPDVLEALTYVKKLLDIPVYPTTFSTMKLGEAHVYFHTGKKAAMFLVGSWYAGRAFVSPEKGGQPADFKLGMLRYPTMPNGKGNDLRLSLVSGSIAVAAKSPHKELALELLQTIATTEVGNMWMEQTGVQTGMKTENVGGQFKPYFDEYDKVHSDEDIVPIVHTLTMPPALLDAYHSVMAQGFPLGQVSLQEAIKLMEEARLSISK